MFSFSPVSQQGIERRLSTQTRCAPCYDNDNDDADSQYCFGEMLCGAVYAEIQQELLDAAAEAMRNATEALKSQNAR